jgi:hypothetical protein
MLRKTSAQFGWRGRRQQLAARIAQWRSDAELAPVVFASSRDLDAEDRLMPPIAMPCMVLFVAIVDVAGSR